MKLISLFMIALICSASVVLGDSNSTGYSVLDTVTTAVSDQGPTILYFNYSQQVGGILALSITANSAPCGILQASVLLSDEIQTLPFGGTGHIQARGSNVAYSTIHQSGWLLLFTASQMEAHTNASMQLAYVSGDCSNTSILYTVGFMSVDTMQRPLVLGLTLSVLFVFAIVGCLIGSPQECGEFICKIRADPTSLCSRATLGFHVPLQLGFIALMGIPSWLFAYERYGLFKSGAQDICFYNFECATMGYGVPAINSVFANLTLGVFGLALLLIVFREHAQSPICPVCSTETPYMCWHFALMGLVASAMIAGSLASMAWEVCPDGNSSVSLVDAMTYTGALIAVFLMKCKRRDSSFKAGMTGVYVRLTVFLILMLAGNHAWSTQTWFRALVTVALTIYTLYHLSPLWLHCVPSPKPEFCQGYRTPSGIPKKQFLRVQCALWIFYSVSTHLFFWSMLLTVWLVPSKYTFTLAVGMSLYFDFGMQYLLYFGMKSYCEHTRTRPFFMFMSSLTLAVAAIYFDVHPNVGDQVSAPYSRDLNRSCVAMNMFDNDDLFALLVGPFIFCAALSIFWADDNFRDPPSEHELPEEHDRVDPVLPHSEPTPSIVISTESRQRHSSDSESGHQVVLARVSDNPTIVVS